VSIRRAPAQRHAAWPEPVKRGKRHRLRVAIAKSNNLGRDVVAVASRQDQTIADGNMAAQTINIDHQTREADHPSFQVHWRQGVQRSTTYDGTFKERSVSH
jgi:hypothetical protein